MTELEELQSIYGQQFDPQRRVESHRTARTGIHHWRERRPLQLEPGRPVTLFATTSGPLAFDRLVCRYRFGQLPWMELPMERFNVTFDNLLWDYVSHWQGSLPAGDKNTILWYQIAGRVAGRDRWIFAETQAETSAGATQFALSFQASQSPKWARRASIYHIFLDRFNPGENTQWLPARNVTDFYGGTLAGIEQKLPYIQNLGFDALWLSPIFASPSHHGYDSTDLFSIEPRLGTQEDFDRLLASAHSRGLRILLDFVPNHWSDQHPTFLKAIQDPESPFRPWYVWHTWPGEYESYYQVSSMPKLNLAPGSPARQHLIEAAQFWLQRGVDGYRLDHVEGPVANFWVELRQACQQVKPDCWLFGEIVRSPDVLRTYAPDLHGCLDFAMAGALRETFAVESWSLDRFHSFLNAHQGYFPENFSLPAFLDNHDMNRFVFLAGGDHRKLKLAALLLYSLGGPLILYYGTEAGISQDISIADGLGLDEARLPMVWGNEGNKDLLNYFARLGALRQDTSIPANAERKIQLLDGQNGLYAFSWETDTPLMLLAINRALEERTVRIDNPFGHLPKDRLNDSAVWLDGGMLAIRLPPRTGAWIQ